VRLEVLGQLQKLNYTYFIGNRARDLTAYTVVSQSTTLPRVLPDTAYTYIFFNLIIL
jgi:hypothetical protein